MHFVAVFQLQDGTVAHNSSKVNQMIVNIRGTRWVLPDNLTAEYTNSLGDKELLEIAEHFADEKLDALCLEINLIK
jgi:hypothetical protein